MPEEVKTDKESVMNLCNSLNAWKYPMRWAGFHVVSDLLEDAERMILTLYSENQALKGKKEDN